MKHTNVFKKSLPVIAVTLSNDFNVKIVIGGRGASTDGERITIPDYDINDPDDLKMAKGYLAHECAHIRYKSFDIEQHNNAMLHELHNVIEDVRIERLMATEFKGTKSWLLQISSMLIKRGKIEPVTENDELSTIFNYYLLYMAYFLFNDQKVMRSFAEISEKVAEQKFGRSVIVNAKAIISDIPNLQSSQDALNMAKELLKMLKDESEKQQEKSKDEQPEQSEQSGGSSNDNGNGNGEIGQNLTSLINTTTIKDSVDMSQLVKAELDQLPISKSTIRYWETHLEQVTGFVDGKKQIAEVRKYSNGISAKLANFMQQKRSVPCRESTQGKLNTRQLHRCVRGDRNLFIEHARRKRTGSAIHFCIDYSGSMVRNHNFVLCRSAVLAIMTALESIPNVTTSATSFPACDGASNKVNCLKTEKDSLVSFANKLCSISPRGGSPISVGFYHAAKILLKSKQSRKILFLFTDGGVSTIEVDEIYEMACALKTMGDITVFPIGITNLASMDYFSEKFGESQTSHITELGDLKTKLFALASKALI